MAQMLRKPDEVHWVARSAEFVKRLKAGNLKNLTTHLTHPGVPPSVVMGAAQAAAGRYNTRLGLTHGDSWYIDKLNASRSANAVVSALISPILLIGSFSIIGFAPAVLAAFLIAFDPASYWSIASGSS